MKERVQVRAEPDFLSELAARKRAKKFLSKRRRRRLVVVAVAVVSSWPCLSRVLARGRQRRSKNSKSEQLLLQGNQLKATSLAANSWTRLLRRPGDAGCCCCAAAGRWCCTRHSLWISLLARRPRDQLRHGSDRGCLLSGRQPAPRTRCFLHNNSSSSSSQK